MPKGLKVGGRDWVKGQSGNPKGRPKLPMTITEIRKKVGQDLVLYINQMLGKSLPELKEIAEDKTGKYQSFIQIIASCLHKAAFKGEPDRMDMLLNRVIGKVKEKYEFSGDEDNPIEMKIRGQLEMIGDLSGFTEEQLENKINELIKRMANEPKPKEDKIP